ncbi:MerR family transcriptional regulator [Couchioplanes caeruleus]|uniref:MerR family transcriptional regulator n=1 Tax=Couchioplanes caeruleus TaxID=56438 RepID=UPI00201BF9E9|nr:MerR family transcriptional regulator [Couchioplanes caeruleus]UQU61227.1 MerR family transcriptional regulator [Couchioplanes caeruleus]
MDELLERVRGALAAEYPGAPNGRVRDVPDRRAVRWYTTTGLVDRPAAMRGRTALYGRRHLLQLVALKRRQAQGHSLAAIQAELAGAPDEELATVARVPQELLTTEPPEPQPPARPRFWTTAPAPAAAPAADRPAAAPAPEIGAVALGGGAILILPVRPSAADRTAVAAAAEPLLSLLAARGLLDAGRGPHTDDGSPS